MKQLCFDLSKISTLQKKNSNRSVSLQEEVRTGKQNNFTPSGRIPVAGFVFQQFFKKEMNDDIGMLPSSLVRLFISSN